MSGMIDLILIAVQAFRRQEPREELGGMRGKSESFLMSSCNFYQETEES